MGKMDTGWRDHGLIITRIIDLNSDFNSDFSGAFSANGKATALFCGKTS